MPALASSSTLEILFAAVPEAMLVVIASTVCHSSRKPGGTT